MGWPGHRHWPAVIVTILAPLATLCEAGCDKKESGGTSPNAGTTGATPSASHGPATLQVNMGCALVVPGGNVLPKLGAGTLSIAAEKGKALVVDTAPGGAHATRILLGATGAPEGAAEPIDDVLAKGTAASTFASAIAFEGELASFAFAYGAPPPTPTQCADGVFAMKRSGPTGARRDVTHACRTTTMLRAAARREIGVAILDGPAGADAWILDRADTRYLHLEHLGSPSAAIVETAAAAGATSVAAAWVVKDGPKRELHAARIGRGGERLGAVEVLDKQHAGSVAMAFEGDTLHVVWSSFRTDKNIYALQWTKWPAGGAPAPPQAIGTGVVSASSPSIAIDGSRIMLAWVEGDEKTATVKVGASKTGLVAISGAATVASNPGVAASGPVVAVDDDAMFVTWKESGSEVRASTLKCR